MRVKLFQSCMSLCPLILLFLLKIVHCNKHPFLAHINSKGLMVWAAACQLVPYMDLCITPNLQVNDSQWEAALVCYLIACRVRLQEFMLKGKTFIVWLSNQSGSLQTTEAWCDHRLSRYGKLIAGAQLAWLMFLNFDWQALGNFACLNPGKNWPCRSTSIAGRNCQQTKGGCSFNSEILASSARSRSN